MSTMQLTGHVMIACSCDWGCPCNFNARPTRGHCEGGWIWAIVAGEVGGVPVGGLAVAVLADWPGAIHEGGGKAVAYIDERASDDQRGALSRLVRGEAGGPWGIFINTYDLAGPHSAPFRLELAGLGSRAAIGEYVDLQFEPIRNPVTGAEAHPGIVLPEGLVIRQGSLGTSRVFHTRGDVAYDHSGQYAALGPFEYRASSDRQRDSGDYTGPAFERARVMQVARLLWWQAAPLPCRELIPNAHQRSGP